MTKAQPSHNIITEINDLRDHINLILDEKRKDEYFEAIALIYSFLEDILKWLVFIQIMWNKSSREHIIPDDEYAWLKDYCNKFSFYSVLNAALSVDLLDYSLFKKLNDIRIERNQIVHQYWLHIHKGKKHILRKKLEKLAGAASDLVGKLNDLVDETGMDQSYGLFDIKAGKKLIQ
jgi:hypothetical protein